MKKSLLTLGLGFGLGFLAVSFFVGPQKVEAEIMGRVRSHQARKPVAEARAESLTKNYFHKKKFGKTKASQVPKKIKVAKKTKAVKKAKIARKSKKKIQTRSVQRKAKKPLVLDFTT